MKNSSMLFPFNCWQDISLRKLKRQCHGVKRINEVSGVQPLGTINICTNRRSSPSISCWDVSVWTKEQTSNGRPRDTLTFYLNMFCLEYSAPVMLKNVVNRFLHQAVEDVCGHRCCDSFVLCWSSLASCLVYTWVRLDLWPQSQRAQWLPLQPAL